jgi:hypothetical protein
LTHVFGDLTHKILLYKERKGRKVGEGSRRREDAHEWVRGPFLKKASMQDSLVIKRIEKISWYGFNSV